MTAVSVGVDQTELVKGAAEGMNEHTREARNSRLGGVHGCRRVPDVLCALEHPEGQTSEEVSC